MKEKRQVKIDPSTVCVIDAKSAFDHLVRESTGSDFCLAAQECMRDQEEHADTEGKLQMGASTNGLVVDTLTTEAMETVSRSCDSGEMVSCQSLTEDRELAIRKVYRETHERFLRPASTSASKRTLGTMTG